MGTGLLAPTSPPPGLTCGGTERWPVKVANDASAKSISPNPLPKTFTVAELNQIKPGPLDTGGRMEVEKKQYTVRGFLSYFKDEEDGDYHVVIADKPGEFTHGEAPPNGRSMVVEFPDESCFSGKSGLGAKTSMLGPAQADARIAFEDHVKGINGHKINQPIPVTVTGVGFFDRDHGQTGRATPYPQADGRRVVFELHPVTEITFDNEPDPD